MVLKSDENDLEALLLRGKGYYYIGDHDVAIRYEIVMVMLFIYLMNMETFYSIEILSLQFL